MPSFSWVICCYKGLPRLRPVLLVLEFCAIGWAPPIHDSYRQAVNEQKTRNLPLQKLQTKIDLCGIDPVSYWMTVLVLDTLCLPLLGRDGGGY